MKYIVLIDDKATYIVETNEAGAAASEDVLVPMNNPNVQYGDEYRDGDWYRDGIRVLTPAEELEKQNLQTIADLVKKVYDTDMEVINNV